MIMTAAQSNEHQNLLKVLKNLLNQFSLDEGWVEKLLDSEVEDGWGSFHKSRLKLFVSSSFAVWKVNEKKKNILTM